MATTVAPQGQRLGRLERPALTGVLVREIVNYSSYWKASTFSSTVEPTIYLLVERKRFGRPMARFMKELDGKLGDAPQGTQIVAVWLTDDLAKTKEYLPVAQGSLKMHVPRPYAGTRSKGDRIQLLSASCCSALSCAQPFSASL